MRKRIIKTLIVVIIAAFSINLQAAGEQKIQMAILLDTSSSMDGLIDQAKSQLWKIVNEMAIAKKNGKSPELEIALFEYGKSSLSSEEGYISMIVPLTRDLDKISEKLFELKTNGGSEYCGMVIDKAAKQLKWNKNNKNLKLIFIAGNEEFTQGPIDYRKSCKNAISKGIIINTIFCGDYQRGIKINWKAGADLADGKYMNIDQNQKAVHIDAPQDKEIAKLGSELNKTYLAFGRRGKAYKARQKKQDANAASMGSESIIQRNLSKASTQYENSSWDLVDALKNKNVNLAEVKEEELPAEMKGMNTKEREKYVKTNQKKREKIQKRLNKLNNARRKYVAKEMKKQSQKNTLDNVMIKAIREQAKSKNFKFK
jgi:hypothetical protein